jgi:hypothetical protein
LPESLPLDVDEAADDDAAEEELLGDADPGLLVDESFEELHPAAKTPTVTRQAASTVLFIQILGSLRRNRKDG